MQQYPHLPYDVALHLSRSYGGRAHDVCRIAREGLTKDDRVKKLSPGYPYLEAEVTYCARYEWARRADDIIARRTRLAFLNKDAAITAIPKVVFLLGNELNWTTEQRNAEEIRCFEYLNHFGGPHAEEDFDTSHKTVRFTGRLATETDLMRAFDAVDENEHGYVSHLDIVDISRRLSHDISKEELESCIAECDKKNTGRIMRSDFINWWNSSSQNTVSKEFRDHMKASVTEVQGSGTLFG